jgi:hypothetical protein
MAFRVGILRNTLKETIDNQCIPDLRWCTNVHTLGELLDSNEIRHKVAANMSKHEGDVPEAPASANDMRHANAQRI